MYRINPLKQGSLLSQVIMIGRLKLRSSEMPMFIYFRNRICTHLSVADQIAPRAHQRGCICQPVCSNSKYHDSFLLPWSGKTLYIVS